jgi:hypothetical protein
MQTIQIQGFNNISDQKIYLENIEYLKQHLNEILEISEQTLTNNLIQESDFLFKQVEDSSKTYLEKAKIFNKLNQIWLNHWDHYRNRPEAIDLMESIDNLTSYFIAHYHIFFGLSYVNEGRTGNEREDLQRVVSGLLILSESVDVFLEYLSVSELKQIYLEVKKIFASTSRNMFEYLEEKEELRNLETQLRAYCSFIILRIEQSIDKSYLTDLNENSSQSQISTISEKIIQPKYKDLGWDLLVNNYQGKPILGVQLKTKMNTSSDWAVKFRHNLLMDNHTQKISFFLMAFPNRFYLWTEPEIYSNQSKPTYIIDAVPVLKPYFERAEIIPEKIRGDSFELLVASWLSDMINSEQLPEEFNESQHWLIDSGLYVAISGGDLKYGATT